jgi:predicted ATP-grasp superfamily ATP-dependent carboligase
LKIFICEFITSGGLYREPLPPSLLKEGTLMRDAVLHDFSQLSEVEINLTYDARLSRPSIGKSKEVGRQDDVWALWDSCIQEADAVLFIAPETGGILTQLTLMAERLNKQVLGCCSSAVQIATDKYQTYLQLQRYEILTIPTYLLGDFPKSERGSWVAKPIDGAGCGGMALFDEVTQLQAWMKGRESTHIIQPLQHGEAASFSMLCKDGRAHLLTCNRQKIVMDNGAIQYQGGVINALISHRVAFEIIAQRIAKAFPGLAGYVGVDLIIDNEDLYVVEINPRLTTSYVALYQACGVNPARMLRDLFYNDSFDFPAIAYHTVDISLDTSE